MHGGSLLSPMTHEPSSPTEGGVDRRVEAYLRDVEQSLLEASVHEAELEEALETRTTIGQATGLLMAHGGLRPDEAFQKLVDVSQNTNIKIREIAQSYVNTWEDKMETEEPPAEISISLSTEVAGLDEATTSSGREDLRNE